MISVPGVGSGLDVNSIVSQLVAAEGDAKTLLLTNKRTDIESEISAFGSLKSVLTALQSSTTLLKNSATFDSSMATSADPTVFTASTTGTISPGVFDIEVRNLAEAHKLISSGFADANTAVGTGTMTITVGSNSFNITIDSNSNTLSGIRDAINNASDNTGVSATIVTVDDGAGGTQAKLILTADKTGVANTLTITVVDDDANHTDNSGLSVFYYDTGDATTPEQLTQITAASDAEIYIDGQKVLSSSNTVVDAIEGVTLNLLKTDVGVNHQLNIAVDKSKISDTITTFVTNYNAYLSLSGNLTVYDSETQTAGILLGDATLRTLSSQLRTTVSDSVTGISGIYKTLVDLGITTDSSGQLVIDSSKLDTALTTNLGDVAALFSSTNGIASKLDGILNEYVKADGIIDNKTSGLNDSVTDINDDLVDLEEELNALEERLFAQFSALDVLLSQLQTTSDFLTQQFNILDGFFKKS